MSGPWWTQQRLAFADAALERAWWAWFAAERGRVMRGGLASLLAGVFLFAPLDALVFPELRATLFGIRGAAFVAMLGAVPAFFGRHSDSVLARNGQEWLLWVCAVAFAGLGSIGWVMAPRVDGPRLYVTLVTLCLLLAALYGATGLRVRYAVPLGVGCTVAYVLVVATRVHDNAGLLLASVLFGGGANLLGLVMSHAVEREGRRAFLRARELEGELDRSERLLLNVMPRSYADRVGRESGACVDRLADATVIFATLLGFEAATRGRPPMEVVALLDRVIAAFDTLAAHHGVERIKTIGATWMGVAGATMPRADHPLAGVRLAMAMRDAVDHFGRVEHLPDGVQLALRVGIASGPLVVGVIGRSRYAFDCWGDTVNTAARLDAHGEAGRIHVNASAAERLGSVPTVARGLVLLKGKGEHPTWWAG